MLTSSKLEALGRIMELEHFAASRVVFNEGEVSDKMYVLVSGGVGIFKLKGGAPAGGPTPGASPNVSPSPVRPTAASAAPAPSAAPEAADGDAGGAGGAGVRPPAALPPPPPPPPPAEPAAEGSKGDPLRESWAKRNVMLAECNQHSKNPWFGETALFNDGRPRGATAFTVAESWLLSVNCSHARKLQEIIPEFFRMNLAYSNVYKKVNQLNGTEQSNLDLSEGPKLKATTMVNEGGKTVDTVNVVQ